MESDGRGRTEHGGDRRGNGTDKKSIQQSLQNLAVLEKSGIPLESKSRPNRIKTGVIERIERQNEERKV